MAETTYTYSISADIISDKCAPDRLAQEVADSAIVTALEDVAVGGPPNAPDPDRLDVVFKAALSAGDKTLLDGDTADPAGGIIGNHSGEPLLEATSVQLVTQNETEMVPVLTDPDHRLIAAMESAAGAEATKATHNFCDPCTWFQQSVREEDETLTDSGDGLRFNSTHENWIDMYHGRILDDSTWRNPQWCPQAPAHKYEVIVEVDGVEKTMQDPDNRIDGDDMVVDEDYYVDYENGDIVFREDQSGNTVTATYSRASTDDGASIWKLYPNAGYVLSVVSAEMQFTTDVGLKDTIFRKVGIPDVPTPGDFYEVAAPSYYMTMQQAIEEAIRNSTKVPAIDETSARGSKEYQQIEFRYSRRSAIAASTGAQIWVGLARDKVLTGGRLTVTFHFVVDEE